MGFFSNLADKLSLSNIFDTIRKSEFVKNRPILDTVLNNPIVDEYFNRDLNADPNADSSFEKFVAVATAKFSSKYLGFDREKSKNAALSAADFVRDVRRTYQYQQHKINEKEYNQHKEVSLWGRIKGYAKAAWEVGKERVKNFVKEKGLSWLLKKAVEYIPNPVVQLARRVWDIIPSPVKIFVKEGAKKLVNKAVEAIPVVIEKVKDCAKTVVKTTVKIVEKGIEKAKEFGRSLIEVAKPVVETAKTVIKTGWECVKSVGRKVLSWLGF